MQPMPADDEVFSTRLADHRVRCDVCPRHCVLAEGERGTCFARVAREGRVGCARPNRVSGLAVDPVEKKPLYHFHPGHKTLSFGTIGCNLRCSFCQNAAISQPADEQALCEPATPEQIADLAVRTGCPSVSFTYNEPIVTLEFTLAVAGACRARGLKTIAVTAGYVEPRPRKVFFAAMDAANVDLKGFTEAFYREHCGVRLAPVLDTLEYLAHESGIWFEVTSLLIPGLNDRVEDLRAMCDWLARRLGPDVPLHFSAFHPAHRMLNRPATPPETVHRAREIGREAGLHHVYSGNIRDMAGSATHCAGCGLTLIERAGFEVMLNRLHAGSACPGCGAKVPGIFA